MLRALSKFRQSGDSPSSDAYACDTGERGTVSGSGSVVTRESAETQLHSENTTWRGNVNNKIIVVLNSLVLIVKNCTFWIY